MRANFFEKNRGKLQILLFFYVAYANNLISKNTIDIEKSEAQALALFQKFNIKNVSFAVKKDADTPTAGTRIAIGSKGIYYSIVCNATCWRKLNEAEREFVLCHEISHLKRGHPIIGLFTSLSVQTLSVLTPLFIMHHFNTNRYKLFSNILSQLGGSLAGGWGIKISSSVLAAWISRALEYQADRDALEMTQNIRAGISSLEKRKVRVKNRRHSLWADHPSEDDRIKKLIQLSHSNN